MFVHDNLPWAEQGGARTVPEMKPPSLSLPFADRLIPAARDKVSSAMRNLLAGNRQLIDPTRDLGDIGLCGPDSISWQVVSDVAALVGGVRALLLQTCHPAAVSGVVQHSNYTTDPIGRLQRTVEYVTVCTFGSQAEATEAATRVRAVHERIRGTLPDGTPYAASDPKLLEWVHNTLIDSFLTAHRHYGNTTLTGDDENRFVAEQAAIVRLLGDVDAPTTVAELAEHLDSYNNDLGRCPATTQAATFLTAPPLPLWARAPYSVMFAGAAATTPRHYLDILDINIPTAAMPATRAGVRAAISALRHLTDSYGTAHIALKRINATDGTQNGTNLLEDSVKPGI
jgi:uncharacterized protein (DUF2236 family)